MTKWKPWLSWALVLLASCGGKTTSSSPANGGNGTDSNTHWLSRCDEDSDCKDGLSCLCGVCSSRCDSDDACEDFGTGGMCLPVSCLDDGKPESVALCTRDCSEDDDCRSGSRCDGSRCVPAAGYEPCAGLSCGEVCTLCDPDGDELCQESLEPKECHPDGTCQGSGAECPDAMSDAGPAPAPDPFRDLPEDCRDLAVASENPECEGSAERCEQMQDDGSERSIRCWPTSEVEDAERVADCAGRWLSALGADATEVRGDDVLAQATWDQLQPVLTSSWLQCQAECSDTSCDYCADLDEAACSRDAFCQPEQGKPLDTDDTCFLPPQFAGCLPGDRACDEAESTALDPDGACWHFSSICNLEGFDYDVDDATGCSDQLPDCAPQPQSGCEAMAVTDPGECAEVIGYAWLGASCEPLTCTCEGEDCDDIFGTESECLTAWAGCDAELPICGEVGIYGEGWPEVGLIERTPTFSDWTAAEWGGVQALPSEPPRYDVVLIPEGGESVSWRVGLPEIPNRFDVAEGTVVEFRMDGGLLAVREENGGPLLLLLAGSTVDAGSAAPFEAGGFTVTASEPFCTIPVPGCNQLSVLRDFELIAPNYFTPGGSDADDTQSFVVEPLSELEFSVKSDAGDLFYHFQYAESSTTVANRRGDISCDLPLYQQDAFSLVRLAVP